MTKRKTANVSSPPAARYAAATWQALLPWVLVAVSLAIRLFYLRLTQAQPVWWDEAEYLIKARNIALGTPETGFSLHRPLFLSVAMSGLYALGLGERAIRVALLVPSVASVYLTYRVGERLVGAAAGFVGAWLFGMYYVSLFYSMRILTEIPHVALCLWGTHLFLSQRRPAVIGSLPVLVLAVFTRFPAALMLVALAVYCAVSEGTAALRRREYWISAALGVLVAVPFGVQSYVAHGHPLFAWTVVGYTMPGMDLTTRLQGFAEGFQMLQASLGWLLTALLTGGMLLLLGRVIWARGRGTGTDGAPKGGVLVLLWMTLPFLYFCLFVRPVLDRYLVLALPPAFLALGYGTMRVAALARRIHPLAAVAVMLAVLVLGTLRFVPLADRNIRARMTSYAGLQDAGLWIKARSGPEDILLSRSVAQLTYYTERRGQTIPEDRTEFDTMMATRKPRYVVISRYEPHPQWLLNTRPESLGLRAIAGFPKGRVEALVLAPIDAR